ncbi:MAG: cytochrome c [Candidatus Lambdaproteobacteria bacterium]|nr:cytochrome c [Candidatus Lambdaproteobacteria bacterium]
MRLFACLLLFALFASVSALAEGDATRGEYLYRAAGGCGCHTDRAGGGAELAGGRAMKTPFGTFYSTNITADAETGIGRWSDEDFIAAMTRGVAPHGRHLFPVFPYPSFAGMTRADLLDLKAYLFAQPAVRQPNRPHEVWPPFGWRWPLPVWKWLNLPLSVPTLPPARRDDPLVARGSYLVNALGHCAECHTPRNLMGGLRNGLFLAGSSDGPEGELAPNITPHKPTGLGGWSARDITWLLESGFKPDGDDVQGLMAESIEHGYGHLTLQDRDAIAAYLGTIPAVDRKVSKSSKNKGRK